MIIAALGSTSCSQDLLEIPQKGVVAYDDFYKTPEDAESAALAAYKGMFKALLFGAGDFNIGWCIAEPLFVLKNSPSDDIYYGSGHKSDHVFGLEINEFRPSFDYTNTPVNTQYNGFYQAIYSANLVITNFEYGTDERIDRAIAEAKMVRAWAHFELAELWGTPPLVDHLLDGADRPSNSKPGEVLDFCIDEFEEAAAHLPSKAGLNDGDLSIRFTKEAALAFAGKARIFKKDWEGAKKNLKAVISSGKYALVDGSRMVDLFHMAGDGCEEKVFELNYINNPGNDPGFLSGGYHGQQNSSCFWRDIRLPLETIPNVGWGGINPSKSFAEALIANDGMDSYRRKAWILTFDDLIYNMSYDDDTPEMTKEQKAMSEKRGLTAGVFGNAGYWSYKMAPLRSDLIANDNTNTQQNHVVMRYAEVLLLYAEACAMTNDNDGLQYLQAIQNRAGSQHVSSSLTMDEVKKEKRLEMYLEGTRFFDLVRWGDAEKVLGEQGKSIPTAHDRNAEDPSKPHELYVTWDSYNDVYGFKAGKNELMPFPRVEMNVNPNIVQNPGW